jgi:hypothetical protein
MSYESPKVFSDKSCLVTKLCSDGKPCPYASCSYLDTMGKVHFCRRHDKNRNGFHVSRGQVSSVVSIFNKHLRLLKLSKFLGLSPMRCVFSVYFVVGTFGDMHYMGGCVHAET